MSMLNPDGRSAVLVRVADAEVLGGGPATIRLLVDSDTTDGAIRANRTLLGRAPMAHHRTTTKAPPRSSSSSVARSRRWPATAWSG
jgi:hypothetical protein